jgi:hypothetical protein
MTSFQVVVVAAAIAVAAWQAAANDLPPALLRRPSIEDAGLPSFKLPGLIPDRERLMKMPRAVFGYLSEKAGSPVAVGALQRWCHATRGCARASDVVSDSCDAAPCGQQPTP